MKGYIILELGFMYTTKGISFNIISLLLLYVWLLTILILNIAGNREFSLEPTFLYTEEGEEVRDDLINIFLK